MSIGLTSSETPLGLQTATVSSREVCSVHAHHCYLFVCPDFLLLERQQRRECQQMATHSSVLAWKIPRTEEPGGLQSMRSQRVGHDGATNTPTTTRIVAWELPSTAEPGRLRSRLRSMGAKSRTQMKSFHFA